MALRMSETSTAAPLRRALREKALLSVRLASGVHREIARPLGAEGRSKARTICVVSIASAPSAAAQRPARSRSARLALLNRSSIRGFYHRDRPDGRIGSNKSVAPSNPALRRDRDDLRMAAAAAIRMPEARPEPARLSRLGPTMLREMTTRRRGEARKTATRAHGGEAPRAAWQPAPVSPADRLPLPPKSAVAGEGREPRLFHTSLRQRVGLG